MALLFFLIVLLARLVFLSEGCDNKKGDELVKCLFTSTKEGFSFLNDKLDKLESKMDKLESKVDKLESKVDKLESVFSGEDINSLTQNTAVEVCENENGCFCSGCLISIEYMKTSIVSILGEDLSGYCAALSSAHCLQSGKGYNFPIFVKVNEQYRKISQRFYSPSFKDKENDGRFDYAVAIFRCDGLGTITTANVSTDNPMMLFEVKGYSKVSGYATSGIIIGLNYTSGEYLTSVDTEKGDSGFCLFSYFVGKGGLVTGVNRGLELEGTKVKHGFENHEYFVSGKTTCSINGKRFSTIMNCSTPEFVVSGKRAKEAMVPVQEKSFDSLSLKCQGLFCTAEEYKDFKEEQREEGQPGEEL